MIGPEEVSLEAEIGRRRDDLCNAIFKEWMFDLSLQEKEIWLWNAMVEMAKIKSRRGLSEGEAVCRKR